MKKNTTKKGRVRVIVFRDKKEDQWYAVALEFNIVVSGDTPEEVHYELHEAMTGYLDAVRKIKGLRDYSCLNQESEALYEKIWSALEENRRVPSPYQIAFHGFQNIYA